jgi:cell division initiation protein
LLTPLDIQNKELRRSFRGYNEEEVDEFLDQLAQDYEWLYLENQRLKEKLEDTEAGVARYRDMEQTIKDTLVMAQKNAEELRENAKRESELLLSEARQKANQIVKEAEEKAYQIVSMAEDRADEITADAEAKVQSTLQEYQWLDKQARVFRVKFRSFLQTQLDLLERQEEETIAPILETASTGTEKTEEDLGFGTETEDVQPVEEEKRETANNDD